jgi:malate synthase
MSQTPIPGVTIRGPAVPGTEAILSPEALAFVADLVRTFRGEVHARLAARRARRQALASGARLDFLPETRKVREDDWKIAPLPEELLDRRVEITGPVDRKMIINALNSGANVFMADFEDSTAPTWKNVLSGQRNLVDAVRRTITFESGDKKYALAERTAVLMVRPRGWHLPEKHLAVDGEAAPAALVDFGLFFFHNAKELLARGTGPYFYLPKMESHLEARLWNGVFLRAEHALSIPRGTIKATVLIETLPAAFEMDEIIFELREHMAGLNCGRWDYIFSTIKTRAHDPAAVLPDRSQVTMDKSFLRAYSELLVKTCHRRGAFAMGGMAAYIPVKGDAEKNAKALAKVRADKEREAKAGHDGTWVAHPGLVAVAREAFDAKLGSKKNQLDVTRDDVKVGAKELLDVPEGTRTMEGLRHNVRVGILYLEAWLGGQGCVPLYDLMEDAATAEICRAQVWQWIKHRAKVDGRVITKDRLHEIVHEELVRIRREVGEARFETGNFTAAQRLFERLATADEMADFLTLPAYEQILTLD